MSIDAWANDQDIFGKYLKFPETGEAVLDVVFLNDGEEVEGKDRKSVDFSVEKDQKQWIFSTSSKRLLKKLIAIAKTNNNSLVGIPIKIRRIGKDFETQYECTVIAKIKPVVTAPEVKTE